MGPESDQKLFCTNTRANSQMKNCPKRQKLGLGQRCCLPMYHWALLGVGSGGGPKKGGGKRKEIHHAEIPLADTWVLASEVEVGKEGGVRFGSQAY